MTRSENQRIQHLAVLLAASGLLLWLHIAAPAVWAQQDEPTPTPDPLAIPVLPENPTQVDLGRVSYYYNCMPCHGDQGQGLTDEWRATWVDDHQNCWARGCHSNRYGEEGFPIPTVVPPVAGTVYTLINFSTPDTLYDYLQSSHPPQNPGILTDEDYWALTAFLLSENNRLPDGRELGKTPPTLSFDYRLALILALALVSGIFILTRYRRKSLSQ